MKKIIPLLLIAIFSLISLYSLTGNTSAIFNPQPGSYRPGFKASTYTGTSQAESRIRQYQGQTCERSRDEYRCMLCNCMRESAGEPLEGKKLVGLVVQSRVEDSRWPNDICSVIYQYKQFSWTNDGGARRALPRTSSQSFRECVIATDQTINAPGNGMDHYHADYVSPRWARRCKMVKKIGRHMFYDRCTSEGRRGRGTHPATRTTR